MVLEDGVRKQLPRTLRRIDIFCLALSPDSARVFFQSGTRTVELEIDPKIGLTDADVAYLCVVL